jgi:hypothetical protein
MGGVVGEVKKSQSSTFGTPVRMNLENWTRDIEFIEKVGNAKRERKRITIRI